MPQFGEGSGSSDEIEIYNHRARVIIRLIETRGANDKNHYENLSAKAARALGVPDDLLKGKAMVDYAVGNLARDLNDKGFKDLLNNSEAQDIARMVDLELNTIIQDQQKKESSNWAARVENRSGSERSGPS